MSDSENRRLVLRIARPGDAAELAVALQPEVSGEQLASRWLEHNGGHREMLIAELDWRPVGTISFGGARHRRPSSLRCFALDVGRAYRRHGIGTALIAAVEEQAGRRNLMTVHLEVAADNSNAIRLYERLGYEKEPELFVDSWTRISADGVRQSVEAPSYLMVKRV
jgi:ribosomal protein S18 acetylase RimI-like enzyme